MEHNGKGNYASRLGEAGAAVRLFKTPMILHKVLEGVGKVLIWFFLMGMIAGAVGWHMFVIWYGRKMKEREMQKAFKKGGEDS